MTPYLLLFNFFFLLSIIGAGHALLTKKYPSSALIWVAVCLSFPVVGLLVYILFGVNRVKRSAKKLRKEFETLQGKTREAISSTLAHSCDLKELPDEFIELEKIGRALTGDLPLKGNEITPLYNGQQAFPIMKDAIKQAKQSVYLSTYLLIKDDVGKDFVDTLIAAHKRGIHVAVLIDGFGLFWSWVTVVRRLRKHGVPATIFMPLRIVPPQIRLNLRNHRKLLVVDGTTGFAGGMNIGGNRTTIGKRRMTDMHFKLTGPIVCRLQEIFLEDWAYAKGESHQPFPTPDQHTGNSLSRVIQDGPDNPANPLHTSLVATINAARKTIHIMTPYFLPSREIASALTIAALRGVAVHIILPAKCNLPFMHWASRNYMQRLLEGGVRIFYQPPPFCHTKLLIVDDCYTQFGSANLDPRSLQLNFELNIEVLDTDFADQLMRHINTTINKSHEVSREEIVRRSIPVRLRDAFFWLFSPYL